MELKRAASRKEGGSSHSAIGHQELLLKRDPLLKNRKKRWFLLDSVKNQVEVVL